MRSVSYLQRSSWFITSVAMFSAIAVTYIIRGQDFETEAIQEEVAEEIPLPHHLDRQLDVRANLGDFFDAQESFKLKHGHFTTDIFALGWRPQSVPMNYKMGFLKNSRSTSVEEDSTRSTTEYFLAEIDPATNAPFESTPEAVAFDLNRYAHLCRQGCTATENGFEIMIAVPGEQENYVDVWLLNEKQELVQVGNELNL